jgi:hypothetical protein
MGLIQALVEEVVPFPKQSDYQNIGDKQMVCVNRLSFSFLNLIFQTIDCIAIPFFTWECIAGKFNIGWISWLLILVGGIASIFSIFQFVYYFIIPAEKYSNPLLGRIFGETAIGGFIAALFKIKIKTYVE